MENHLQQFMSYIDGDELQEPRYYIIKRLNRHKPTKPWHTDDNCKRPERCVWHGGAV